MTMMTVNEVSKLTGVSIRTLQYYDAIGLLKPSGHTASGYRLYDDTALERLQEILLFKELAFSLKEIKEMLDAPGFDWGKALTQQIELLTLKREHIDNLIDFARKIRTTGVKKMDFTAFDTGRMDEYARRAREQWGQTSAYREYEEKTLGMTEERKKDAAHRLMLIFAAFGMLRDQNAASDAVRRQVKELQDVISAHYYHCTDEILSGLGKLYAAGGEFTENIDRCGGEGTAAFAAKAIELYCRR